VIVCLVWVVKGDAVFVFGDGIGYCSVERSQIRLPFYHLSNKTLNLFDLEPHPVYVRDCLHKHFNFLFDFESVK